MSGQAAPRFPFPAPTTVLSLFVLLVAAPAISFTNFASAGAEEGEALLRFKATLYGLDADLPSWIPGPAPCNVNFTTWEGVICFNGHVWGIQLENRGLVGTLDIEPLVTLIGLRAISFMHNNLAGPLPDLNRLGALKAVYLSNNNFSGEIQGGAFAGMRSLKKLFISDNGFTGPIPESLVNLSKLAELRLDHNEFAGPLPEFSQPGLVTVDVSFNALEGPIPLRLSKMDPKFFQGKRGSTLPPPDFPARLKIVKGVARGLGYLYDELPVLKLPHGHLKSSNVLLNENMEPLLVDYALAPVMNAAYASQVMVAYKSPEVIRIGQPSRKSDVWCFGVLILEILTGKFPANFLHKGSGSGGTDLATWVSSVMKEGDGGEVFDSDMRHNNTAGNGRQKEMMHELLKTGLDCCRENPDERPGMREVLDRIEQLDLISN